MQENSLGWVGILRIGLVQAAMGSIVVLATSTMNRIMVVELSLPAFLPGILIGLHYALQVVRPRMGFGSDVGGRRTPWIIGGMATLATGGVLAALSIALMGRSLTQGVVLAVLAFALIGVGVGAAGTSLLVFLAKNVDERTRPVAATVVWVMMIVGFVVTTVIVGNLLDPYSPMRLIAISAAVCAIAMALTLIAVLKIEPRSVSLKDSRDDIPQISSRGGFFSALAGVWSEPRARNFTIFIFVSMLAYSAQELILEPFAGKVFGFTPGQSTQLTGGLHGGALLGMIGVALACGGIRGRRVGTLPGWTVVGCVASALALSGLVLVGWAGPLVPLKPLVFCLGVANGVFAVAAIGSMMSFASSGRESREGVRMGLWGAAQAIAFGLGGFLGAGASDIARRAVGADGTAYAVVFAGEAALFLVAAVLAARMAPVHAVQGLAALPASEGHAIKEAVA